MPEPVFQTQIQMVQKPTDPLHVARKDYVDESLVPYAKESYVDAADALKADLVGGKIPSSQMPPRSHPEQLHRDQ